MSNKPKYYAFSVKDRGRGKTAIWTRIGAVWAHEKGQGLNIELEALPLNFDGKIVLMLMGGFKNHYDNYGMMKP